MRGAADLEALSQGFRGTYLRFEQIEAQLRAWAEAYPELVRVRSIGESTEGRPLLLATIGPEPGRVRPSVWIDGNMHASELCGSSVALGIAEDVLRLHLDPDAPLHGLSAGARARVRDVLFHVLPRMSPDGAECVLREGRYVRSAPRDRRPNKQHPRWIASDVDGDGLALAMRRRDEAGEFVDSKEIPGAMLPRTIDDDGPFYKLWPEGLVEHFDGHAVPDPYFLSDNEPDLNRNFPFSWAPEPEQAGAGAFPTSEPESRAVVEFVSHHPELFAWLNLHTFGGVFIRPLGHAPDKKMDESDLALYRQLEAWAKELTGYPMVSGFEEFTYEPDKPLHGELSDFAYHQRGCISYVVELWDLFAQLGIERKKPFVDHYTHFGREDLLKLARWDREKNQGRVLRPWRAVTHPQLGEVEVGGIDGRVGVVNPPYEMLAEICQKHAASFLRVAALAPHVVVREPSIETLGEGLSRIEVVVENLGYLPTFVLSSAKKLAWNEPLHVDATARGGCTLTVAGDAHREVGHLDGWGRGLFDGSSALYFGRSRGSGHRRTLSWVVRGRAGALALRVGSCRVGWVERVVELP